MPYSKENMTTLEDAYRDGSLSADLPAGSRPGDLPKPCRVTFFDPTGRSTGAFQTTKQYSIHGLGDRKSGRRSVRRIPRVAGEPVSLQVGQNDIGEWKAADAIDLRRAVLSHTVRASTLDAATTPQVGSGVPRSASLVDKSPAMWMWCCNNPEELKRTDVHSAEIFFSDELNWAPYAPEASAEIEEAQKSGAPQCEVSGACETFTVKFLECDRRLAMQHRKWQGKERLRVVRRFTELTRPALAAGGAGDCCAICIMDMTVAKAESVCLPACGHRFHRLCLQKLPRKACSGTAVCPLCRANISDTDMTKCCETPAPPVSQPKPTWAPSGDHDGCRC